MADSDRILSGEEVDFNQLEYITVPEEEWEDTINPDESVSQVLNKNSEVDSEASTLSGSSIWLFFDKNPDSAPGYNVCKECSAKYKLSSSVTTLRKHLEKHRFKVPTKKQVVETKKKEPFKEDEQKKHDEYLVRWHKAKGLTIHYIDSNWRLCNFLLDIIPFTISHTGINISQEITRVLEEFGISNKIIALTTDNESAMLGLKSAGDSIAKARKLINTIKKSTRTSNSLQMFCELKKIKYLKLILDTEISLLYVKRLKELEPALTLLAADNELNTILLLESLEKATVYLSASLYPTIGEIRLVYSEIQSHLERFKNDNDFKQKEMTTSIFEKIDEYWAIMDKYSITSAILDPRNKLSIFTDELEPRQHIQNIYKIYKERSSSFRPLLQETRQIESNEFIPTDFSITESEKSELDRYLALPNEEEIEPLLWWHAHANEFPIISDMARDFLSIQATSVALEQAFSVAGNTITKTRNRLHPETARACLCVKSWITNNLAN
ncbi:zinc finger BED domain-containing protein RICESLEEPER 2-like [Rhizophagus clarus]|uniref:Zinc finger BED domain-containing protein RICESLEEPER 2-like n=1 Tax=Rhizophagus clarus TaxID=94130 RepID=A0A8H3LEE2_9GLOM|nr:zinc finger BED domain-containing protein RICESLEEPER 2-like [Rhizophagus clarus]